MPVTMSPSMQHRQRRFRVIHPRLQWRLVLTFFGVAALTLCLEYILFVQALSTIAAQLPEDGARVLAVAPERLAWVLALSIGVLFPIVFFVAVTTTHRVLGPLYRIERHLKDVVDGRTKTELRLRKGDELQELCELINRATLRASPTSAEDDVGATRSAA